MLPLFIFTHFQVSNTFNSQSPVKKIKALLKIVFLLPQETVRKTHEQKYKFSNQC